MMPKKKEEDKKQKVTLNINEKLNDILIELMKDKKMKKSQIIEDALKFYNSSLEENGITETDIFRMLDKLKNKDKP